MTPTAFLKLIVDPTLQWLAPLVSIPMSDEARVLLMAIAGQESSWTDRLQGGGGPARGYWQFEQSGGVEEVFDATPRQIHAVCTALDIPFDEGDGDVFEAMAWNDTLACSMARLLLWQDPAALPALGDAQGAYVYYDRNWRPGDKRPQDWPANYITAMGAVTSAGARLYPDQVDKLRSSKGVPL